MGLLDYLQNLVSSLAILFALVVVTGTAGLIITWVQDRGGTMVWLRAQVERFRQWAENWGIRENPIEIDIDVQFPEGMGEFY